MISSAKQTNLSENGFKRLEGSVKDVKALT